MAKYEEVSEQNEDIFKGLISEADLERYINVKILADNRQKTVYNVVKANALLKHMTAEDVIIIINETIFDKLEDNQKLIVADEAIAYIGFDFEKDRLIISKPDLTTFKGIIRKYSFPIYERLEETIKSLYEAENNPEANA